MQGRCCTQRQELHVSPQRSTNDVLELLSASADPVCRLVPAARFSPIVVPFVLLILRLRMFPKPLAPPLGTSLPDPSIGFAASTLGLDGFVELPVDGLVNVPALGRVRMKEGRKDVLGLLGLARGTELPAAGDPGERSGWLAPD